MWRAALRSIGAHKLRLGLTALAIVLGVSFVSGTFVFTDSLKRSFDALFDQRGPDVLVEPAQPGGAGAQGGQGGGPGGGEARTLSDSVVAKAAAVPGVAVAEGYVSSRAAFVLGPDGKPLGADGPGGSGRSWIEASAMNPLVISEGRAPERAGEVVIDRSTADRAGVGVGGTIQLAPPRVIEGRSVVDLTVVGVLENSVAATFGGGTLVALTFPEAQQLFEPPGQVSSVRLLADPGVSQAELAGRVATALGPGVQVTTGQQQRDRTAQRIQDQLAFLNTFLLVFALIALFVASFLIYNTFSMLVAQRTRELALLRAIGASRRQVQATVLGEAAVVGLVASTIGLVAGLGLALLLRALFAAFGATLPGSGLVITPRTVIATYAVGLVVTLVCAWFPARRTARVPPVAALRDDVAMPAKSLRVRAVVAGVLVLVAVALAVAGLRVQDDGERAAQIVGFSALSGVIAAIAAAAFLARPVLGVLGAPARGVIGRLARENGRRNPRRTAATSTALTIGVALMAALSVIAASATASVAQVVDDTIGADYVVLGASFRPFPPEVFNAVKDAPGLSVATYVRQTVAQEVGPDKSRQPVTGIEPSALSQVLNLTFTSGSLDSVGLGTVLVDSDVARANRYSVGDDITLALPNGKATLRVVGIFDPAALYRGFIVSMPTLTSIGSLEQDSAIYLKLAEGADPAAVRADLDTRLSKYPTVTLQDQTQLKDRINDSVNSLLGFLFALLALAIIIAVLGIINTLLLSVVERTREIGLLRAVGATRPQVRRMVVLEAVLIAVFGAVVGVVVGVVYGVLLQRVLADQGISVLAVPWTRILMLVLLAAVGGVFAALWPARRAARLDVLRAISTE